jgi:hypothetical protein
MILIRAIDSNPIFFKPFLNAWVRIRVGEVPWILLKIIRTTKNIPVRSISGII